MEPFLEIGKLYTFLFHTAFFDTGVNQLTIIDPNVPFLVIDIDNTEGEATVLFKGITGKITLYEINEFLPYTL